MQSGEFSKEAHARIMAMIVNGQLKPGDALLEATLAQELGMSRTPVREAIRRVIGDGLTEKQGRAIRVRRLSVEEVEEVFFLRLQLEPFAARRAVGLSLSDVDAMAARIDLLMQTRPADDLAHLMADEDFHELMRRPAGNTALDSVVVRLRRRVRIFDHGHLPERLMRSCREHLDILDCVRMGDADATEIAMRRHIENARDALLERCRRMYPGPEVPR